MNHAPVAANDSFATDEDTPLVVLAAQGVLANDTDVDGNSLTAVVVTGPGHGGLTLNANDSFTYTPAGEFNGAGSLTYKANEGPAGPNRAGRGPGLNPVNNPPRGADS